MTELDPSSHLTYHPDLSLLETQRSRHALRYCDREWLPVPTRLCFEHFAEQTHGS